MVRMDECVEALYDKNNMEQRNKNLQMIKIMKSAISVSKSRTGDCIFRNNKMEKRNLDRLVRGYKRDCDYISARYDSRKKETVRRWMKLLERQTTFSSQTLLEEMLDIRDPVAGSDGHVDGEEPLLKLLDLRLNQKEAAKSGADPSPSEGSPRKEEKKDQSQFVTEKKEIRQKYDEGKTPNNNSNNSPDTPVKDQKRTTVHGVVLSNGPVHQGQGRILNLLPPIGRGAGRLRPKKPSKEEGDEDKKHVDKGPERDPTNWKEWGLTDKKWVTDYIFKQKSRHDDLIMRNALVKIRSEMSDGNSIERYRIRQRLHSETSATESTVRRAPVSRANSMPPSLTPRPTAIAFAADDSLSSGHKSCSPILSHPPETKTKGVTTRPILKPMGSGAHLQGRITDRKRKSAIRKSVSMETSCTRTVPGGLQVILESPRSEQGPCLAPLPVISRAGTVL